MLGTVGVERTEAAVSTRPPARSTPARRKRARRPGDATGRSSRPAKAFRCVGTMKTKTRTISRPTDNVDPAASRQTLNHSSEKARTDRNSWRERQNYERRMAVSVRQRAPGRRPASIVFVHSEIPIGTSVRLVIQASSAPTASPPRSSARKRSKARTRRYLGTEYAFRPRNLCLYPQTAKTLRPDASSLSPT